MKKFLIVTAIILALLFIVDKTILKEKGIVEQTNQSQTLERLPNPDTLPVGLRTENKAPSFTLNDLEGNQVSLEDFKGKKVLLNFWASWCPPCKAEMPDMESLYKEHKDDGFVVLAVNMTHSEENIENVTSFVDEHQLSFPIILDESGSVGAQYEVLSYPTSYFIDSDGVIRGKIIGAMSKEHMFKEMSKLP